MIFDNRGRVDDNITVPLAGDTNNLFEAEGIVAFGMVINLDPAQALNLTGLLSYPEYTVQLWNIGNFDITITHDDPLSAEGNRFFSPDGDPIVIGPFEKKNFMCKNANSRNGWWA